MGPDPRKRGVLLGTVAYGEKTHASSKGPSPPPSHCIQYLSPTLSSDTPSVQYSSFCKVLPVYLGRPSSPFQFASHSPQTLSTHSFLTAISSPPSRFRR